LDAHRLPNDGEQVRNLGFGRTCRRYIRGHEYIICRKRPRGYGKRS
jgi:hypothetical protein